VIWARATRLHAAFTRSLCDLVPAAGQGTPAGRAARFLRAVAEGLVVRSPPALLVLQCLAPWADEVAHRLHVGGVAGKGEAAEMPAVLDCCQHRVVVEGDIGGGR